MKSSRVYSSTCYIAHLSVPQVEVPTSQGMFVKADRRISNAGQRVAGLNTPKWIQACRRAPARDASPARFSRGRLRVRSRAPPPRRPLSMCRSSCSTRARRAVSFLSPYVFFVWSMFRWLLCGNGGTANVFVWHFPLSTQVQDNVLPTSDALPRNQSRLYGTCSKRSGAQSSMGTHSRGQAGRRSMPARREDLASAGA